MAPVVPPSSIKLSPTTRSTLSNPTPRSNLAVTLLTNHVVNGLDLDSHSVDWNVHMHLMLHITFLGLDNNHPVVHKHCKQERNGVYLV